MSYEEHHWLKVELVLHSMKGEKGVVETDEDNDDMEEWKNQQ